MRTSLLSYARRATGQVHTLWGRLRDDMPTDCPLCLSRARGGRLCAPCERELTHVPRSPAALGLQWRCGRCALPLPEHDSACPDCADRQTAFDRTYLAFDYQPPADALVLQMKYGRRPQHAALLGHLLAEAVRQHQTPLAPHTVLVPVPASHASLRSRGFNPAREIARTVAADLGLALAGHLVFRRREQVRQSTLDRAQRLAAVEDLYGCHPEVLGRQIALVDDVMTTGSTLHAMACVLKSAGAAGVVALVAARTPHPVPVDKKTTLAGDKRRASPATAPQDAPIGHNHRSSR